MPTSLNTGISGLQQFQRQIEVIGNNIANVNTTGYKSSRMNFEDSFSQALAGSGAATQVGSGVGLASINNNFKLGTLNRTGVTTDLAVSGNGFFMVQDAVTGVQYATRAGDFTVNSGGYLVTNDGLRVQGFNDGALATRGDLKIDVPAAVPPVVPPVTVKSFSIGTDGTITVHGTDGVSFVRGQVLLQSFSAPSQLIKEGNNLYSGMAGAGPLTAPAAPPTNGLGSIESGVLEMSNVDLTNEMTNLIMAQRAFTANSKTISTSDEIMQEINNLKR